VIVIRLQPPKASRGEDHRQPDELGCLILVRESRRCSNLAGPACRDVVGQGYPAAPGRPCHNAPMAGCRESGPRLVALGVLANDSFVQRGKSEARPQAGACEVELALFPGDNIGLEVQVNLVVADGVYRRDVTRVASVAYLPEVPDLQEIACGQLFRLATVRGDPVIEVGLMFLRRAAVRKGRTGNWKPRQSTAGGLLSKALFGPKAGEANLGTIA
jgi:hypothetical protein